MPPPLPQPPVLFYSEGSPYARICRMALRERGLAGAVREVVTTLRDPNVMAELQQEIAASDED